MLVRQNVWRTRGRSLTEIRCTDALSACPAASSTGQRKSLVHHNHTIEYLEDDRARLIVYPKPLHPEERITHDFDSMEQLLKYVAKATAASEYEEGFFCDGTYY